MDSSNLEPPQEEQTGIQGTTSQSQSGRSVSPVLPEIPKPDLSLDFDLSAILGTSDTSEHPEVEKVKKRASNVLKLSQENEKLKAELKAMTDRIEAAEQRRAELAKRGEQAQTPPTKEAAPSDSESP